MLELCGGAGFSLVVVVGAAPRCGAQDSPCGGFSCWGAWALWHKGFVVSTHGLTVVALRLRSRGSTAGVRRLSCSVACETLLLR